MKLPSVGLCIYVFGSCFYCVEPNAKGEVSAYELHEVVQV